MAEVISFDAECSVAIRKTLEDMLASGDMLWSRKQVLTSDEAARVVIARLPIDFRAIDTNHFRRIADPLEKKSAREGGFPHFTSREMSPEEEILADRINRWSESREHDHSEEYTTVINSPDWRIKCKRWKELFDFRCAACGEQKRGDLLEIHHYTYARLGNELDTDVCCVCSGTRTKQCCHALLDFARERSRVYDLGGLFQ